MVTSVGTEDTFAKLVQNLLVLEHDAIAAYEKTIEKLEDNTFRAKVQEFKREHDVHVVELERLAQELGIEAPKEGDLKEYLTTGKVALASMVGDKTILKAMSTNEVETKMAYEQAAQNTAATPEARAFFQRALADETRHKAWMDQTASQ